MVPFKALRLFVLAGLVTAGLTASLSAIGTTSGELDYFSDATLQNQVGLWIKTCTAPGHDIHQGTVTSYTRFYSDGSCGNGGCQSGTTWASVWNNAPDPIPADCMLTGGGGLKNKGCNQYAPAGCTGNTVCSASIVFCAPN